MCANISHIRQPPYSSHHHRYLHIYYFFEAMVMHTLNNRFRLVRCMFRMSNDRHDNAHYHNIRLCFHVDPLNVKAIAFIKKTEEEFDETKFTLNIILNKIYSR